MRIVVHGACAHYVDAIKAFIDSVPSLSTLVAFDFAHPASDTIAVPTTRPDAATERNVVRLEDETDLEAYVTKSTGWPVPL